jgi:hypothetical protein
MPKEPEFGGEPMGNPGGSTRQKWETLLERLGLLCAELDDAKADADADAQTVSKLKVWLSDAADINIVKYK